MRRFDMAAVNHELGPWLRMTARSPWAGQPIVAWPAGRTLFASWILFLGVLPVDRHRFALESPPCSRGFRESSSSWCMAQWRHERRVESLGTVMQLTDRIEWHARLPGFSTLLAPIYRSVFRHRHRQLRRRYGAID
jgi:hypothetical protein